MVPCRPLSHLLCCCAGLLLQLSALAQVRTDSIYTLPGAEVSARPLSRHTIGVAEVAWDTTELSLQAGYFLPDLLERTGTAYIKSYGGGSIATTSIRGGSAGQTAVTWNGLPLQSPMLGQLDFSLFPLSFTDEAALQLGSGTASWGSGAVGGTVVLNNRPLVEDGMELGLRLLSGSFGLSDQQARLRWRKSGWAVGTRLFHRQASHDFWYELENGEERQQQHAAVEQKGGLQEVYWSPSARHEVRLLAWWQASGREVPPTTVQARSRAFQLDTFLRTALRWEHTASKGLYRVQAAWFRESIDYADPLIALRAYSYFKTLLTEAEGEWQWGRQHVKGGLFSNYTQAVADGYGGARPQEHRMAAFGSVRRSFGPLTAQLSARQGISDGQPMPFVPDLGLEWRWSSALSSRFRLNRSFRLPTLNDRYWAPGGDPALQPEQGWGAELGIDAEHSLGQIALNGQATVYHRRMTDWILWSVEEGQGFWSANNITTVRSRGLELQGGMHAPLLSGGLRLNGSYAYSEAVNLVALQLPALAAGQQLPYTPRHLGHLSATYRRGSLLVRYWHRWAGAVGSSNQGELPGYNLGGLHLQHGFFRWRFLGSAFLRADNIWGASYRVVERRPMPGRAFQIGFNFTYKK